jgi:hypothetical protein
VVVIRSERAGVIGPLLYGALFVAALPAGLLLWARALDVHLDLPHVQRPIAGGLAAACR